MRPVVVFLALIFPIALCAAEKEAGLQNSQLLGVATDYQLGGSTSRAALVPEITSRDIERSRSRLSLPIKSAETVYSQREALLGGATLFVGEASSNGRDAVEMGTFLTNGTARAGVSVTYIERDASVSRSEVFLDYALTDQFSVGLYGILNSELDEDEAVPQLGLSAEYATEGGAFLLGGVADAADYNPVIGLSIGLRF